MPKTVVSATDLVRKFGDYARSALADPVQIAQHGHIRLALVNADLIDKLPNGERTENSRLGARFDILFDAMETMITIVDHNVDIVRVNAAALRYFEVAEDDVGGRPLHTLLSAPEMRTIPAAVLRVVATGQVEDFFVDSRRYSGRTLHVRIMPFPGGAALFGDDITERLTTARDDALRIAHVAALDAAGIGAGSINVRGVIDKAEPALERLTGAPEGKLLNVRLSSLFTVRCRDAVTALIEKSLTYGEGGAIECELLTEQGPVSVCLSMAPVEARRGGGHATFLIRTA